MIKVVNLISLLAAPLIVEGQGKPGMYVALVVLAALVLWSILAEQARRIARLG